MTTYYLKFELGFLERLAELVLYHEADIGSLLEKLSPFLRRALCNVGLQQRCHSLPKAASQSTQLAY